MKKIAVILAGCGRADGSEIHEAVMALLAVKQQGAEYFCFAPDILQYHVINHFTGTQQEMESRNVLVEAARLARGKISALTQLRVEDYDAILLPGGFGVAKNLDTYALQGVDGEVLPDLAKVLKQAHAAKKPIGLMCIAPVIAAKLFPAAVLTVGKDNPTVAHLKHWGATHVDSEHGQVVHDEKNRLFSTPCYMHDTADITDIYRGATQLVKAMVTYC